MPMVFGVVNQGNAVDNALSAHDMDQRFLVAVTQVAVVLRSIVYRTLPGQS